MPKPVVVFDSSVLFSYVYKPAEHYTLLAALRAGAIESVTCPSILAELRGVAVLFGIEVRTVDSFMNEFVTLSRVAVDPARVFKHGVDSKDDMLFNLAIEQKASHLISHDSRHVTAIAKPTHPQHDELKRLAPNLKVVRPAELVRELTL